jgi:hypothetical protein
MAMRCNSRRIIFLFKGATFIPYWIEVFSESGPFFDHTGGQMKRKTKARYKRWIQSWLETPEAAIIAAFLIVLIVSKITIEIYWRI